MHIEDFYRDDFPIRRAIDLRQVEGIEPMKYLPSTTFKNCNLLVLSLLGTRDILPCLEKKVDTNGITDQGMPFLTPLLWNAFIHMDDWEREKKNIETMLRFPIDCNYIGLCGFNLYHFYILQALFTAEAIRKLEWWIQFPMVDVNMVMLNMNEKKNHRIEILHPLAFILSISEKYGLSVDNVLHLLVARGLSIVDHVLTLPAIHQVSSPSPLFSRLRKQWDNDLTFSTAHLEEIIAKRKTEADEECQKLPTPMMNEWYEIPTSHSLSFSSHENRFLFHASYMDIIKKTHVFPFTHESIDSGQIDGWLAQMGADWFPREEFVTREIMAQFPVYANVTPSSLSSDQYAIQYLYDWITSFYPYSRIMLLLDLPWKDGYLFEYICREMSRGTFLFRAFQEIAKKEDESWKDLFFWAAYDSLEEGYIFSNRLEELISRLELFIFIQERLREPFHHLFPSHYAFKQADTYQTHLNRIQLFMDQYDYSSYHIYHFMRQISILYDL